MGKTKRIELLSLIALTLAISWVTICPVQAQIENVGTSSGIFVDNIVEGQPISITIQIYPAPPSGETFSNISVGIVSPLQGISGNGPWDQKNIVTDTNGVAKVTFNIPTFGSAANWNVWLYFGGQYFANNTIYYQSGHWERSFFISPAQTSSPTPIKPSTLGPLEIRSAGDGGTNVEILNIQNQSSVVNPVQILFRVNALLLPYCYSSVGNIGYSVDGGTIHSVYAFINETIIHNAADEATVWVNVTLPSLVDGAHTLTIYWGWYFEGINQRYEVSAYSTVNFSVNSKAPSLTPSITKEPTQTPNSTSGFADTVLLIGGIVGVVAVAAIAGTIIYLKKNPRK